jgi:hypothetical protein
VNNFALEEILDFFKRGILWIIVNLVFFTRELKNEACNHYYSGTVRIPGACYGYNLVKGYRAIGELFPERRLIIRLDFVLGYLKVLALIFVIFIVFYLLGQWLS